MAFANMNVQTDTPVMVLDNGKIAISFFKEDNKIGWGMKYQDKWYGSYVIEKETKGTYQVLMQHALETYFALKNGTHTEKMLEGTAIYTYEEMTPLYSEFSKLLSDKFKQL